MTIRVDQELDEALALAAARSGKTRSEVVREALRRQLALQRFDELREAVLPYAERRDLLTDEDVFSAVS
jgi:predicted transcriptional regulator